MYDELARIESIYGSVAEYNRVMLEESEENYREPSDEEILQSECRSEAFNKKLSLLNGEPSDFIKGVIAEWSEKAPLKEDFENYNDYVYKVRDFGNDCVLNILDKVAEHYGITLYGHDKSHDFYHPQKNTLSIAVEYREDCYIKEKCFLNLDYETFKNVFRDLYEARVYPTCSYDTDKSKEILCNISLGELRNSYFVGAGFETEGDQDLELDDYGFDLKEYAEKLYNEKKKEWGIGDDER